MVQLEVLNTLEKNDREGRFHCVALQEWFNYRGHVCMAFEKLGLSLYDCLRRNSYSPFQVNLVCACYHPRHSAPHCILMLSVISHVKSGRDFMQARGHQACTWC